MQAISCAESPVEAAKAQWQRIVQKRVMQQANLNVDEHQKVPLPLVHKLTSLTSRYCPVCACRARDCIPVMPPINFSLFRRLRSVRSLFRGIFRYKPCPRSSKQVVWLFTCFCSCTRAAPVVPKESEIEDKAMVKIPRMISICPRGCKTISRDNVLESRVPTIL